MVDPTELPRRIVEAENQLRADVQALTAALDAGDVGEAFVKHSALGRHLHAWSRVLAFSHRQNPEPAA